MSFARINTVGLSEAMVKVYAFLFWPCDPSVGTVSTECPLVQILTGFLSILGIIIYLAKIPF